MRGNIASFNTARDKFANNNALKMTVQRYLRMTRRSGRTGCGNIDQIMSHEVDEFEVVF